MLLKATTGTLPADYMASIPRWSGPDPVIVQVQCILYSTLSAALLAAFLAMLGKQWLNRYKQNEFRGSLADRNRLRERKLTGLEAWKFHIVMESLPLILQCALVLLGFALSRYLWVVNTSVSSVVMGFLCFGFLFYLFITTASVFSFDCPFQTPFSLLIRFVVGLSVPHWRNFLRTIVSMKQPFQLGILQARFDLPLSMDDDNGGHEPEPGITSPSSSITPLFIQEKDLEGNELDARCIDRLFDMSTDVDVIISIVDFIPEILWHGGIKRVPLKRIYNILIDCFDFSGAHPVVVPKLRDIAYLSARAFVHVELQRRCITQLEEQDRDSWTALCAGHHSLYSTDYDTDPDLATALYLVDMTLGHDVGFSWKDPEITPPHCAWMSHVFVYRTWHEGQVSEVVIDFIKDLFQYGEPSDVVITDCFIIIGLMIGVNFHVNDITVKGKRFDLDFPQVSFTNSLPFSRKKKAIIADVFKALTTIFSSGSTQIPTALRALRLVKHLRDPEVHDASYELFRAVMAPDNLEDQHWEAARLAVRGAFGGWPRSPGEPKEIVKFLDYHVGLQGVGEDHGLYITYASQAILFLQDNEGINPLGSKCVRDFDWASPSFVGGIRSMMRPHNLTNLRRSAVGLIALVSDRWFDSSAPVFQLEERLEFCEHVATFTTHAYHDPHTKKWSVAVLFGMLRSPEWRKHIVTGFWSVLAYCPLVEELESVKWCLQNATELLKFTRGLPDGEGLKWWHWTLWFHYDRLDKTTQDEVKKVAVDMWRNDGHPDLHLYLNLFQGEASAIRKQIDELPFKDSSAGMNMKVRLTTLEGNYDQLARITAGRQSG